MSAKWAILIILACFSIVGRIDYEVAISTADMSFKPRHAEAKP